MRCGLLIERIPNKARSARTCASVSSFGDDVDHQLQPLVEPQLGQAWHEPARIICTPHCMHIGASLARGVARGIGRLVERCRRDW